MLVQHAGHTYANESNMLVQNLENIGPTCWTRFPWPLQLCSYLYQSIYIIIIEFISSTLPPPLPPLRLYSGNPSTYNLAIEGPCHR